jgi:hypothetical protein
MRFGQLEVRTIATVLLAARSLALPADFRLTIRQMPTISPKQGLPVHVGTPVASGSAPLHRGLSGRATFIRATRSCSGGS